MYIYSYTYNVETGEDHVHQAEVEDYEPDEEDGYEKADFNSWADDCVYCESLVSGETAKQLVMDKCLELSMKFGRAYSTIWDTSPEIHL